MSYSISLNKDKNIGKVVYVVEGARRELTLLSYIFTKIFDYSVVVAPRKDVPYIKYESKTNKLSRVFLVCSYESNISFVENQKGQDYLNEVYRILFEKYDLELSDAATYFIFDRDIKSNKAEEFKKLIPILKNSRDNDMEINGMLLVSYPAIEAYVKSSIDDTCKDWIKSAQELKLKVSEPQYQQDKFKDTQIINACVNMLSSIKSMSGRELVEKDLDDFAELNKLLFEKEEDYLTNKELYRILSLLSISFIDLGLISIQGDNVNG